MPHAAVMHACHAVLSLMKLLSPPHYHSVSVGISGSSCALADAQVSRVKQRLFGMLVMVVLMPPACGY